MGSPTPIIIDVAANGLGDVIIEASDGNRYYSDLSSLKKVYCYPKNSDEWKNVSIDSYGMGLIWGTRFEVHIDQIIALATKSEPIKKASYG
ncbi:MAG: hypothetical protein HYS98_08760 [Deltaproteobacteria bacterium]|nr:hypothetical protein [Deltaproteobacteria bacterium]